MYIDSSILSFGFEDGNTVYNAGEKKLDIARERAVEDTFQS